MRLDTIHPEECLAGMQRLPESCADMILCDLPYGTTANRWDTVIPFEPLWEQYKRIAKPGAAIVLTAQAPFDKQLYGSNPRWFRYEWIWEKSMATGHLWSHHRPMKAHENVLVFCDRNPPYFPQGLVELIRPVAGRVGKRSSNYGKHDREHWTTHTNYPRDVLRFPSQSRTVHPTQKPVALFEYLVRTYTRPGAVVVDNCMGSGTTAIACLQAGRHFVGFETDSKYVAIAEARIAKHVSSPAPSLLAA